MSPNTMTSRRQFDSGPLADPEERQVIFATLDSFRQYRRISHYNITHLRRQNLYALPERQWKLLAASPISLLDTLNAVDDALDHNADIADAILELGLQTFELPAEPQKGSSEDWHGAAKSNDLAKAHSTIRQFYREWSAEGFVAEIEPLEKIILDDLIQYSLTPSPGIISPTLLLPGAGLGRLLFSMCMHGYSVEGNEISYHQLLASNLVLNNIQRAEQYELFPFVSTFTNHKRRENQLRAVCIPDIHPATVLDQRRRGNGLQEVVVGSMNMTAGDFITSYGDSDSHNKFDGVLSVYFVDTAPNLIRYIETIRNCLRDNGLWINIGPLLWHFDGRKADTKPQNNEGRSDGTHQDSPLLSSFGSPSSEYGIGEPGSFELSDQEVLYLLENMGFEVLKHEYIPTHHGGYIQDPDSMLQNRYECSHWIARKMAVRFDQK